MRNNLRRAVFVAGIGLLVGLGYFGGKWWGETKLSKNGGQATQINSDTNRRYFGLTGDQKKNLPVFTEGTEWQVGSVPQPEGFYGISAPFNAFLTDARIVQHPGDDDYDVQGIFSWEGKLFRVNNLIVTNYLGQPANYADPEIPLAVDDPENLVRLQKALLKVEEGYPSAFPKLSIIIRGAGTQIEACQGWADYFGINLKETVRRCRDGKAEVTIDSEEQIKEYVNSFKASLREPPAAFYERGEAIFEASDVPRLDVGMASLSMDLP